MLTGGGDCPGLNAVMRSRPPALATAADGRTGKCRILDGAARRAARCVRATDRPVRCGPAHHAVRCGSTSVTVPGLAKRRERLRRGVVGWRRRGMGLPSASTCPDGWTRRRSSCPASWWLRACSRTQPSCVLGVVVEGAVVGGHDEVEQQVRAFEVPERGAPHRQQRFHVLGDERLEAAGGYGQVRVAAEVGKDGGHAGLVIAALGPDLVDREPVRFQERLQFVPPGAPRRLVDEGRAAGPEQLQVFGERVEEPGAGRAGDVCAAGVSEGRADALVEVPHRRHELRASRVEVRFDGGDDPGSGVGDDVVGVVAELVEDEPPGRRVRLRHRPHQSQPGRRALPLPVGLGQGEDEEPGVAAGLLRPVIEVPAVHGHVVDQHDLRPFQHLAVGPHLVEPGPLVVGGRAELVVDRFVDDRGERLDPVGADVPGVPGRPGPSTRPSPSTDVVGLVRLLLVGAVVERSERIPVLFRFVSATVAVGMTGVRFVGIFAAVAVVQASDPLCPTADLGVGGACGELLETSHDHSGRPRVPAGDGRVAPVDPSHLLAVLAVVDALVHVVPRQWGREPVRLRPVGRRAPVPLPTLRRPLPVRASTHDLRPRMVRARGRGVAGDEPLSFRYREAVRFADPRHTAVPAHSPLRARAGALFTGFGCERLSRCRSASGSWWSGRDGLPAQWQR